ncbi:MAG: regulatory protein RecX [Eggerthellaceae bacterium]|nr:regulatory protein RecX [Eggerthellaceae bacterium]
MAYNRKRAEETASLPLDEQEKHAFEKAVQLLSIRELSTAKMHEKLARYGFSEEAQDHAIQKAISYGFIDDQRYCDSLIRSTLSQGKGLERVIREIQSLGIDPDSLEAFEEYVELGEDGLLEAAMDVLSRSHIRSKNIKQSAYRKLIMKGYPHSIAAEASRRHAEDLQLS